MNAWIEHVFDDVEEDKKINEIMNIMIMLKRLNGYATAVARAIDEVISLDECKYSDITQRIVGSNKYSKLKNDCLVKMLKDELIEMYSMKSKSLLILREQEEFDVLDMFSSQDQYWISLQSKTHSYFRFITYPLKEDFINQGNIPKRDKIYQASAYISNDNALRECRDVVNAFIETNANVMKEYRLVNNIWEKTNKEVIVC